MVKFAEDKSFIKFIIMILSRKSKNTGARYLKFAPDINMNLIKTCYKF